MEILLTFTGFHDPYSIGLIGEDEQPGPIVSLAQEKHFDKIILFSTPNTIKNTSRTLYVLHKLFSSTIAHSVDLQIDDPTDYISILREIRKYFNIAVEQNPGGNYYISIASGTPQMHASWLLLTASREFPATILHTRPPRFVTKDKPLISEIDLTNPEFPVVKPNLFAFSMQDDIAPDHMAIAKKMGIIGKHPLINRALEEAAALAESDCPIMLMGESGVGKELFARYVHNSSDRKEKPFVPLNCAAIPKDLVESILFGHKKGAFTGAVVDQVGKFDIANEGTLFLDELGELTLSAQAKLLRILDDGMVDSLGTRKSHKVDVRIIAASNKNINKLVKNNQFREDLFFRLNVGMINLPPLRNRKSDIPIIALHLLDRVNSTIKKTRSITTEALSRLQNYSWPGNVRELQNVIERSVLLSKKDILDSDDLLISEPEPSADPLSALPEPTEGFSLENYITSVRKQLILQALDAAKGNQSEAARLLGISPQAVHKFLQKQIQI